MPNLRSASTGSSGFPLRHAFAQSTAAQDSQQYQYDDWTLPSGLGESRSQHRADAERLRRQRSKQHQDTLWKERQSEHRFRRYCYLSGETQRRSTSTAGLIADFASRLSAAQAHCHNCNSAEHLRPVLPAAPITFACINGYATVDCPEFLCQCGQHVGVHLISAGCFPATPSRPVVWYDNQLLALTSAAQLHRRRDLLSHCPGCRLYDLTAVCRELHGCSRVQFAAAELSD